MLCEGAILGYQGGTLIFSIGKPPIQTIGEFPMNRGLGRPSGIPR